MPTNPRGAIICKSKYGATRQYAQWLSEKLQLPVFDPDIDFIRLMSYDYLVIGSSVYGGKMLIAPWLDSHKLELKGKRIFYFVVSATPGHEKETQERIIQSNIPAELVNPHDAFFLPGRWIIQHLTWKDRLTLRLSALLEKNKAKKQAMQKDKDEVDIRYLAQMLKEVILFSQAPVMV